MNNTDEEYDYYSSAEFQKMLKESDPGLPYWRSCKKCDVWLMVRKFNNLCDPCESCLKEQGIDV